MPGIIMTTFLSEKKKNNIWNMPSVLLFKLLNVGIIILILVQGITNIITKRLTDTKGVIKSRQNVLKHLIFLCFQYYVSLKCLFSFVFQGIRFPFL